MEPAPKNPAIRAMQDTIVGESVEGVIRANRCVKPPIGCGKPIQLPFTDALSLTEYTITGLCQKCQDAEFGELDDLT